MAIPDCRHIVEQLADQFPEEFRNAHSGNAHTHDFIKRVAWVLHSTVNPAFGLLGQRGNANDLAEDAILFVGDDQGKGGRTTDGRPQSGFDVIGGAGGPNPQPAWQDISGPGVVVWVQPQPVDGASPVPTPTPTPTPQPPPVNTQPIVDAINALAIATAAMAERLARVEQALGPVAENAQSAAIDAKEVNAARHAGWPKLDPGTVEFPVYKGSVFGAGITLRPQS